MKLDRAGRVLVLTNPLKYKDVLSRSAHHRSFGYTLIELAIGIPVISALMLFVGIAIWDAIVTFRLSAASAKVVHDIRFAQQQAMSHNGWYGIEFFPSPINTYHVYLTDGTTDTDVIDPANRALTLNFNPNTSYGVQISAVNIAGGSKVEFDPFGRPYSDKNGAALALDGTLSLVSGGGSRIVQIIKGTGRVEMPWH